MYVKATEGTTYRNPLYQSQRAGARAAGYLQGAYHYARPASSSAAAQAEFFVRNGGAWTADGATLPGALDLEAGEKGRECHGKTPRQMSGWVRDFAATYRRLTGRDVVIYVKAELWQRCTGGDTSFASNPLWLYDHEAPKGPLPAGWKSATLWQFAVVNGLDRNVFHGSPAELKAWAAGP